MKIVMINKNTGKTVLVLDEAKRTKDYISGILVSGDPVSTIGQKHKISPNMDLNDLYFVNDNLDIKKGDPITKIKESDKTKESDYKADLSEIDGPVKAALIILLKNAGLEYKT